MGFLSASANFMKSVLMVSTSYPRNPGDWKGVFIKHLADALARRQDVRLSLWCPPGELPDNAEYACDTKEAAWLNELMEQGGIAHLLRKGGVRSLTAPVKLLSLLRQVYKRYSRSDILHINWLQNALPLWGLPGRQPALVSVLGSDMGLLRLPGMRSLLRAVFRQRPCILAPNAEWMVPILQKYFRDIAEVRAIPFGIDKNWYALARNRHQAPSRWLTVSRLTRNKIGPLFEWGAAHFQDKHELQLHLFGPMQDALTIPAWVHYHGPTSPADLMANWFPRASGLITLSRHDEGRPQVMIEAMAASLPIIASHLPAHDNLLIHEQTGWLVDNYEAFSAGLQALTDFSLNETIGQQARQWTKNRIGTWEDCAQRYITAYQTLLESIS